MLIMNNSTYLALDAFLQHVAPPYLNRCHPMTNPYVVWLLPSRLPYYQKHPQQLDQSVEEVARFLAKSFLCAVVSKVYNKGSSI